MFAVIKTGGKQYRVQAGDILRVEKLNASAGDKVQFNDILMIGSTIGSPTVAGAAVQAEVIEQIKADKVITFHKRRRKHSSQRTRAHRQQLTLLRVTGVLEAGADASGVPAAVGTRATRRAGEADVTRPVGMTGAPSAAALRRSGGAQAGTRRNLRGTAADAVNAGQSVEGVRGASFAAEGASHVTEADAPASAMTAPATSGMAPASTGTASVTEADAVNPGQTVDGAATTHTSASEV